MTLSASIQALPFELQNKILYMALEHPTSILIKNLKKEMRGLSQNHMLIDKGGNFIPDPLDFYNSCCDLGYLDPVPDMGIDRIWYDLLYGWD